ncbi:MAG: ASCH domain-containing protein [bacterium]|nr:ASCH domain-containing protein [bacterium]
MEHKMHLLSEPFEEMRSGSKVIEIRLNDEKRQKVKIGDTIVFHKLPEDGEKLSVRVLELLYYKDFKSLYQDVPFHQLGCSGKTMGWMLENTYKIYTREQEEKYGALGIRIELLSA